ncbi:hypothetical protein [Actinocrispum sp. NPDC049592]|uniref:tetratricopeptide repeat protein n=1 Tax=Actinocrispum sp. NPDC049592 TaxID=3154835 RepID=UPI0034336D67
MPPAPSPAQRLRELLDGLHEQAGRPGVDKIREQAELLGREVGRSALYQLTKGEVVPNESTVEAFVAGCTALMDGPEPSSAWLAEVERVREAASRDRRPPVQTRAGRPISGWSAQHLHVHKALNQSGRVQAALPRYVRRAHDDALDRCLTEVSSSLMLVLVADSSTGKTRALFEAVSRHPELSTWPLVFPRSATALLNQIDEFGPRTVVWLNDLHNHLVGDNSQLAATALQELLSDANRGPVVVLGTLWRTTWSGIEGGASAERDLLLHHAERIDVEESFSGDLIKTLRDDPATDRDLLLAIDKAGDERKVIQTMTGGPQLVERYTAPVSEDDHYARAITTAALDARRVGLSGPIAPGLLLAAAPSYLDGRYRINPPADWLARGMTAATTEKFGVAALTEHRRDAGAGPSDGLTIHDYLDQQGRQLRTRQLVAPALWTALVDFVDGEEQLINLGNVAQWRLLTGIAARFYRKANTAKATLKLADILVESGRAAEAVRLADELADRDEPAALRWMTGYLGYDEPGELAIAYARRVAEVTGDDTELRKLLPPEPSTVVITPSEYALKEALVQQNRVSELVELADGGDYLALDILVHHLLENGEGDRAAAHLRRWESVSQVGFGLVQLYEEAGLAEDALRILRAMDEADPGNDDIQAYLADLLARSGKVDELRRRAGDPADSRAQSSLARWLAAHNHIDELRSRAAADDWSAARELTEWLLDNDGVSEAMTLWDRLARTGDRWALRRAAELHADHGDKEEASRLAKAFGDSAGKSSRRFRAQILRRVGDHQSLATLMEEGDGYAANEMATLLAEQGRYSELRRLAVREVFEARWRLGQAAEDHPDDRELQAIVRYGLDPTGEPAQPWA